MNDKIKHYKKDAAPMDCFIVVIEKDGRVRVVGRIEAKGSKDKWAVVSRPVKNLVFDLPRFIQGVHNLDLNWLEPIGMDYLEANFNAFDPVEAVFSWEQARTIGALLDSVPDGVIALTDISLKTPAGVYLVTEDGAPWGKWDFDYDEEDSKTGTFSGVLTDGHRFLFWRTWFMDGDDEKQECGIFSSIRMDEDSLIVAYPWSPDNDTIVTECLNSLDDPSNYCGESCPLQFLSFKEDE